METLERHPRRFVVLFRFAYGLRAVAPVAIGASRVPLRLFLPLNLAAAVAWGMLFTGLGYLAGPLIERFAKHYGVAVEVAVVILSVSAILFALRRGRSAR